MCASLLWWGMYKLLGRQPQQAEARLWADTSIWAERCFLARTFRGVELFGVEPGPRRCPLLTRPKRRGWHGRKCCVHVAMGDVEQNRHTAKGRQVK